MEMSWHVGLNEECILVRESHWQSTGDVPETELTTDRFREPGVGEKQETSKKNGLGQEGEGLQTGNDEEFG